MNNERTKKIVVIVFFAVLGLLADQVKVTAVWGAKGQSFTLLQLFAPAVGAFVGSISGVMTVLLTEVASFIIQGKEVTVMNVFRLLPLLFATLYFGSITRRQIFSEMETFPQVPSLLRRGWGGRAFEISIPVCAMLAFWAHPIGRQVWYFPLYWLIPIIIAVTPLKKYLLARTLGSTFTAHAVGGSYWIWMTNMAAPLWVGLIPVVAIERSAFAIGIAVTYMAVNSLLAALPAFRTLPVVLDTKYRFLYRSTPHV